MSSILTNNSAMVALQTLKSINGDLAKTQSMISTGKDVASAKDNSAVWSISKTMESDVKGFKAVSDSLSLGQSTVAVARNASETITDLLTDMKGKIVAAQEENVDSAAIQADIEALGEQIGAVVNAAQFNGLNLIDGSSTDAVNILSSLDRDSNGTVSAANISVARQNLSVTTPVTAAQFGTANPADDAAAKLIFSDGTNAAPGAGVTESDSATAFDPGTNNTTTLTNSGGSESFTIGQVAEGNSYQIILDNVEVNVAGGGTTKGQRTFEYVASSSDGTEDVARNLTNQINAFFGSATASADGYTVVQGTGSDANTFTVTNGRAGGATEDVNVFLHVQTGGVAGSTTATGGLGLVSTIDVTSDATGALGLIDDLIDQSIDAASAFGSAETRIETQSSFISSLSDSLKSGIGTLVDADMEEASARLQALQVQQQLGIQSLSIANQAPQSVLSLFR